MPLQPTPSDRHIDRALTNVSVHHSQDSSLFVASEVFPVVGVEQKSNQYHIFNRGDFNRNEMKKRAPSTESAGGGFTLSTDNYLCDVWALHKDIDDQERANADEVFEENREATEYLTTQALINREVEWATAYFQTTVWATDFSPATKWDAANSTPIEEIRTGKRTIVQSTGMRANTLVCGAQTFDILMDHPDIVGRLDRGQTTGPAMADRDSLAALFGLDRVLVMEGIQNTAAEGAADVHAFIADTESALLCHVAPRPGRFTASAGYTFSWTGLLGQGANGMRVTNMRVETIKSDRIEAEQAYDHKVVSADLGYFFNDVAT